MNGRPRRALYYLSAFLGVIVLYTVLFQWGMDALEGRPITLLDSLEFVVQTFTTVGYGHYGPWASPMMDVLVITMMATGVFFIFMALPLFVAPWVEETLSITPRTAVDGLEGHVVICSYSTRIEKTVEELETLDIPYIVIVADRDRAADLMESNVPVIHGDPESTETLESAAVADARSIVADVNDETNASIILTADQLCDDTQIISFVEDPDIADYHRYAGADFVFSPRQLIGESLANKITTRVSENLGDAVEIGEDFEIVELPVQSGSEIVGKTVEESGIRERTGANIIGAWFRGEFVSPPQPTSRIDEQTVLLVAGHEHQLEQLKEMTLSEKRTRRRGKVIIAGHGEVGSTVKSNVSAEGIPCSVVDLQDQPGVDIVGDVTQPEVLERAGIAEANTLILALSDDTLTVFATLVVREVNPDIEIIVRADETENVQKFYRAGADYVLALATVSGRMLASTILGEDVISFDQQVEVVRFGAGDLAGRTLAGADIRARTSSTVIAVERDGAVLTDLGPDFEIGPEDMVIVAGPDDSITQFAALYGE